MWFHDSILRSYLDPLRNFCRPQSALANQIEIAALKLSRCQFFCEQVGSGHGILYRQVDSDSSDRGHGVSGIPDHDEAWAGPFFQPVDGDTEQLYIIEAGQGVDPLLQHRRGADYPVDEIGECPGFDVGCFPFGNDESTLPIITSIDANDDLSVPGIE